MYQIDLMPDEVEKLETHAKERGYQTLEDWLRSIAHDQAEEDEDTIEEILADLTQGFGEALRGEGISMEELRQRMAQRD